MTLNDPRWRKKDERHRAVTASETTVTVLLVQRSECPTGQRTLRWLRCSVRTEAVSEARAELDFSQNDHNSYENLFLFLFIKHSTRRFFFFCGLHA